jgi:hypothetical protein
MSIPTPLVSSEFFLGDAFEPGDVVNDLFLQFRRILLPALVIVIAGFRRYREARRDR